MLAAMNTGHEGSLTTLHSNSPHDALSRLETMILMAGMDLPLAAVREHISPGMDSIVKQAGLGHGEREITPFVQLPRLDSGHIRTEALFCTLTGPDPALQHRGVTH